jgi:AraC-like DNA-binding protein
MMISRRPKRRASTEMTRAQRAIAVHSFAEQSHLMEAFRRITVASPSMWRRDQTDCLSRDQKIKPLSQARGGSP